MINKEDKKCALCKINLSTIKSFKDRDDWETIRFCSSKCRKLAAEKKPRRKK